MRLPEPGRAFLLGFDDCLLVRLDLGADGGIETSDLHCLRDPQDAASRRMRAMIQPGRKPSTPNMMIAPTIWPIGLTVANDASGDEG